MTIDGLINNYIDVVTNKYFSFKGRASRREYWYFYLANFCIALVLVMLDQIWGMEILSSIYSLAILVPNLAISVRRLHDVGRSGWWYLIAFVPVIGIVIILIWACTRGDEGVNEYGEEPMPIEE